MMNADTMTNTGIAVIGFFAGWGFADFIVMINVLLG